jgi:hypothetical protein
VRSWPVTGRVLAGSAAALAVTAFVAAVAGPAAAVSVTQFSNAAMIAAEGPGNSLDFYQQTPSGTWVAEQIAGTATTYSAPAVAMVGSTTVIAAEGPGDSLDFYWRPAFPAVWHGQQVAGTGTSYSAPSVAQVQTAQGLAVGIAVEGASNSLDFYYQSTFGTTWTFQRAGGFLTTYSAPSLGQVTYPSGTCPANTSATCPMIAVEGPHQSLRFYTQASTSQHWHLGFFTVAGTTYAAPAVAQVGNGPVIAVQGPANSLDYYYWQTTGVWNGQQVAGGGTTYSAPAVTPVLSRLRGTGTLTFVVIAAEGPSNSLDSYNQIVGAPAWNPLAAAGTGTTYSAPSLTTHPNSTWLNSAQMAAEGAGNSLDFYQQTAIPSPWASQQAAGADTTFG